LVQPGQLASLMAVCTIAHYVYVCVTHLYILMQNCVYINLNKDLSYKHMDCVYITGRLT